MNNFNIYMKVLSNIRKFDDMNLVNNKDIHFLKLNNMIIIFTPLLLFIIISLICGYDTKIFWIYYLGSTFLSVLINYLIIRIIFWDRITRLFELLYKKD